MGKVIIKVSPKNQPPDGFDKIQPTLKKFEERLKILQDEEFNPSRPKNELYWDIHRIDHQKNRYIYSLYYQRKLIDKPLYLWLVKHKFINNELISKWRKQGYENLCCLQCIGETVCVCRVPKSVRKTNKDFKCIKCGCKGCASSD
ncbi:hypothetical protein C6P40_004462 [Pichia californica]|uniref:G10 protein n=1 Tax=Pichia californica TaxID=460514 RepID=A0A9P6WPJ4_9ASCO|nr:hypothetical protein C6P42_000665 [[Candida] californica]KAG0689803.1 hypothetical protein C6P40_004462 [[Candida] californica]